MTLARFSWRSPPPSSVDERLLLVDDAAWLVVCSPARDDGMVGTFRTTVAPADGTVLASAGPGERVFDILSPAGDDPEAQLRAVAQHVADMAHASPVAVAQFAAAGIVRPGAPPIVSLTVTGAGTEPAEFHLDPDRIRVQFAGDDQPLSWQPIPAPGMGFMTPDADLLGGVGLGASVGPGEFGAIALTAGIPANATRLLVELTGMLHLSAAGVPEDAPFLVRTAWSPVHRETAPA